jgi:outer membrane biosynthesis protein TonB
MTSLLVAQTQPTFYAAYQDGLDAERQGQWTTAAAAYRRAIELRPASAAQVIIYGNNLLKNYTPHTRLARCLLETGEVEAAQTALTKAAHFSEPNAEREALTQIANRHRAQTSPAPKNAHVPPQAETTPKVPLPQVTPEPLPQPAPPIPAQGTPPINATTQPSETKDERKPLLQEKVPTATPAQPSVQPPSPAPGSPKKPGPNHWLGWSLGALMALAGTTFFLRRRKQAPEESSFSDPKQLGPYRVERLLGRGGFASTYLAHHVTTGAPVALKLLHPYRHDDPEFLRRFRLEAKLGAMLDHPNLVRMLDPGPETGTPWLAMEFVTGRRLDQKLREDGPPSLTEFARVSLQIAAAMAHAHDHGIVHRDLKPGNVIFEGDQAKVMDFGISRIVDSNTLTTTYAFLGTPRYAAPEAQLKVQVGPAADRYAFGIMLFEMLAGHTPFDGETPFEILAQHQKSPLPDLTALRTDLPASLVSLVEGLCRKNPDERPGDEEIILILTSLIQEPPPRK